MIDARAFRDFERRAHDEIAEGYRAFFTAVTAHAIDPLLDAAAVGAGTRVLDVATGPGVAACRAADRGAAHVVGLDLAPRMVELARERCPTAEFREGDAEDLPFRPRSFDAVVCNFGIGHFPRPERALAECFRVLTPGGRVALSWWDVPSRHRVNGVFFDAMSEVGAKLPPDVPAGPAMFRFSEDAEMVSLLRTAGLVDVSVRSLSFVHRVESADAWWNGILAGTVRTSIGIRRQPQAMQDEIRLAFDRLIGTHANEAGGYDVPVAVKVASGRKARR